MLVDFFERVPQLANQRATLVANINELIELFRAAHCPVLWVRQEFAPDLSDAFLDMRHNNVSITIAGTPGCEVLPELDRRIDDMVIVKKRYSAFFGTDLDVHLATLNPDVIVLAGINSHACVRMTAIDAYQRDFEVVLAADCVSSRDPEHHDDTMRYLDGHIATLMTNPELASQLRTGN